MHSVFGKKEGCHCMKLDIRHLGDEKIKAKLGGIREISPYQQQLLSNAI